MDNSDKILFDKEKPNDDNNDDANDNNITTMEITQISNTKDQQNVDNTETQEEPQQEKNEANVNKDDSINEEKIQKNLEDTTENNANCFPNKSDEFPDPYKKINDIINIINEKIGIEEIDKNENNICTNEQNMKTSEVIIETANNSQQDNSTTPKEIRIKSVELNDVDNLNINEKSDEITRTNQEIEICSNVENKMSSSSSASDHQEHQDCETFLENQEIHDKPEEELNTCKNENLEDSEKNKDISGKEKVDVFKNTKDDSVPKPLDENDKIGNKNDDEEKKNTVDDEKMGEDDDSMTISGPINLQLEEELINDESVDKSKQIVVEEKNDIPSVDKPETSINDEDQQMVECEEKGEEEKKVQQMKCPKLIENNQTDNNLEPELMPMSEQQIDENDAEPEQMEVDEDDADGGDNENEVIEIFDDDDDDDVDDNADNDNEDEVAEVDGQKNDIENNLNNSSENQINEEACKDVKAECNINENDNDDENKMNKISENSKGTVFYGKNCVNLGCRNKCKAFMKAPQFVINFFRIARKNKIQYVCEDCFDLVVHKYESLCDAMIYDRPIINEDIPKRYEVVEVLDSSEEEDNANDNDDFDKEDEVSEDVINYVENNLDDVIKKIMEERVDIKKQLTWMDEKCELSLKELENELNEQSAVLKELQDSADRMHYDLYSSHKVRIRDIPPLDLNTGRPYVMDYGYSIPPPGEITFTPIIINERYYAPRNSLIDAWLTCRVTEINQVISTTRYYKIQFDNTVITRCITARSMAYFHPPQVRLQIGARVIALFDTTTLNGKKGNITVKRAFYPGIIAEPLTSYNRFRYLIFFDDGYAQYVSHKNVRLICHASENVWEDVHISSREFFCFYLTQYQRNRPMVQAKKGQTISTESNGKWLPAKVIDIDASLVQMQFSGRNHTEWIYRGSTRLAPLFKERYTKKTAQPASLPRRTEPFIRYMQDEEVASRRNNRSGIIATTTNLSEMMASSSITAVPTPRSVAKKSTTKNFSLNIISPAALIQSQQPIQPAIKHLNNSTIFVDDDNRPKGKVVYYTARKNIPPRHFYPHECNPNCLFSVSYNLNNYSPLAKPLLSGWERLIYKFKFKKWITYKAPCGRLLRSMDEIHKYLRITKNILNVDNFAFDPSIHCLAEYVIENRLVEKKDLSDGAENMIIPCVNYYDNTMPPECEYSTERIPTEGVFLNLDPEFLVGCDCTDDCSDKSKCACWQLTLEGARFIGTNIPPDKIGYSYKRLPEAVPTGIYECNVRCKCSKNCLNRVVQHPLQMKLQVFKTSNRGWGLRCINDIPKGSFICIYAGHLLTEQNANEGGANFGDEYFAELDYIEVVERLKEGYESDVQEDIEDSDDEPEEKGHTNDSDEEFRLHRKISKESPTVHTRMQTRRENDANKKNNSNNKSGGDDDDTDNQSNRRKILNFEANSTLDKNVESTPTKYKSVRKYFGKDEYCYIMDAKLTGNIGRYFNHSCAPNLFVQNVFVDTHDLRFPWVAFFALHNIKAGTELTWNYNYEVGIVPGKVLYCECGSSSCRGRLL